MAICVRFTYFSNLICYTLFSSSFFLSAISIFSLIFFCLSYFRDIYSVNFDLSTFFYPSWCDMVYAVVGIFVYDLRHYFRSCTCHILQIRYSNHVRYLNLELCFSLKLDVSRWKSYIYIIISSPVILKRISEQQSFVSKIIHNLTVHIWLHNRTLATVFSYRMSVGHIFDSPT